MSRYVVVWCLLGWFHSGYGMEPWRPIWIRIHDTAMDSDTHMDHDRTMDTRMDHDRTMEIHMYHDVTMEIHMYHDGTMCALK